MRLECTLTLTLTHTGQLALGPGLNFDGDASRRGLGCRRPRARLRPGRLARSCVRCRPAGPAGARACGRRMPTVFHSALFVPENCRKKLFSVNLTSGPATAWEGSGWVAYWEPGRRGQPGKVSKAGQRLLHHSAVKARHQPVRAPEQKATAPHVRTGSTCIQPKGLGTARGCGTHAAATPAFALFDSHPAPEVVTSA
jgi:hypothetical protein